MWKYKLFKKLFGWDYIAFTFCGKTNVRKIDLLPDGRRCGFTPGGLLFVVGNDTISFLRNDISPVPYIKLTEF